MLAKKFSIIGIAAAISLTLVLIFVVSHHYLTRYSFLPSMWSGKILSQKNQILLPTSSNDSLTIVTVASNGMLLGGATYSIAPYPFSGSAKVVIKDNSLEDENKVAGIITLLYLRTGNYLITELTAPKGYSIDNLHKVIEITSHKTSATATFANVPSTINDLGNSSQQIKGITYTAKFECGLASENESSVRPGYYATDISIFNRQQYPIDFLWNLIIKNGITTNSIVATVQPQKSTAITCKDIHQLFDAKDNIQNLMEGFVVISVQLNNGLSDSLSYGRTITSPRSLSLDETNILDVQAFYSSNSLVSAPHEILNDQIAFSIINDTSGKIPPSMLLKLLYVTIQLPMNEIYEPISQIKNILATKYNLSNIELSGLRIKILHVTAGATNMVDDHAITSFQVKPEFYT